MTKSKAFLLTFIVILITAFFIFDLEDYFTLEFLKSKQAVIDAYYRSNPVKTGLIYVFIYITVTSISLPTSAIMTLTGGAIFGLLWGTMLASIASTSGAVIAFLSSRFVFRDAIQKRFSDKLTSVNKGIEKDGAVYLFTMRLVPIFPYFIINPVMGLTPIRTITFSFITLIGMLPASIVFVNAGTQIARITQPGDVMSPELIASLVLLGIFPLLANKAVSLIRASRDLSDL